MVLFREYRVLQQEGLAPQLEPATNPSSEVELLRRTGVVLRRAGTSSRNSKLSSDINLRSFRQRTAQTDFVTIFVIHPLTLLNLMNQSGCYQRMFHGHPRHYRSLLDHLHTPSYHIVTIFVVVLSVYFILSFLLILRHIRYTILFIITSLP